MADEIASSDEFKETWYAAIVNIDRALTVPATPVPVVTMASSAPTAGPKVKLPKFTLKSFDGDITAWTPFWDSFKAGVQDNPYLSDGLWLCYNPTGVGRMILPTIRTGDLVGRSKQGCCSMGFLSRLLRWSGSRHSIVVLS